MRLKSWVLRVFPLLWIAADLLVTTRVVTGQELSVRRWSPHCGKVVTSLSCGMQAVADGQAAWLREKVTQLPKGTNTLLITHMPNLTRAFPQISGVADGEALILHPDGKGAAPLVGRIKIEEWPGLRP